jgi:hypothetical protein
LRNKLEKFVLWQDIVSEDLHSNTDASETFDVADFDQIVKTEDDLKLSINKRLFAPDLLLARCE